MNVTDANFPQEVLQSEVPVLVDFYADWCNPCRTASPFIDEIAEEYTGRVKVVKVNVDQDSKYAVENNVRGIPNFIVFKGGERVAQFIGWSGDTAAQIKAALDAALGATPVTTEASNS